MNSYYFRILLFFILPIAIGCAEKDTLFIEKNGKSLGLKFQNQVNQTDIFNILSFEHLYNGGGVGIADFNNDGLQDVFFTGNIVPNKLFLNQGKLDFEDISEEAGIEATDRWSSGVTVVDINNDGWMDLYISCTLFGQEEKRRNKLFVNKGLNEAGIPVFEDQAKQYGIDDSGHSTQAVFFDYDQDNDLDLYLLTNRLEVRSPNKFYFKLVDGSAPNTDRFYRNNGDGTFSNVSREAGISIEGYGLGIHVFDVNQDGWLDIYVANDYLTNDVLYVNNQDGTFSNRISDYIKHQSHSSMGCDVADINNDGLPDIMTVEMLPLGMERMKRMWTQGTYSKTINNEKLGYDFQYMRNMLQVNQGMDISGNLKFSDLSFHAGVEASEWSWAVLMNDFDADGDKDIFIANGFPKDITDLDFISYKANTNMAMNRQGMLDALPESRVRNCLFENQGDLTFKESALEWGIEEKTFSNGAAYGDLDNDGDLDIVVNNINSNATVLINNSRENQYLNIELEDAYGGAKSTGAEVKAYVGNQVLTQALMPVRGYLSSMQPLLFFGLGKQTKVDSFVIKWSDGTIQKEPGASSSQKLTFSYRGEKPEKNIPVKPLFEDISAEFDYKHLESRYADFNFQRLLPRQYSLLGPSVAVGDIDNNGEQDMILGGSLNRSATLLMAENGKFKTKDLEYMEPGFLHEDGGLLLFDADNDGDLDLYATGGGYEEKANTAPYQDRFYVNDGKGNLVKTPNIIPAFVTSTGCVRGADYDKDGDIDLFIGGRIDPHRYPRPVSSYLLRNDTREKDKIKFTNVIADDFPELIDVGMVTDAVWADIDLDGWMDLVTVGEWMAPRFYKNKEGQFSAYGRFTDTIATDPPVGWWNSLVTGDFDNDGDTDFIAGNLGTNAFFKATREAPLHVFARDFDKNGGIDVFFASQLGYEDGRLYPLHARDDLFKQMQFLQKRVFSYEEYAKSAITDLFSHEELEGALHYESNWLYSSYVENKGNGTFTIHPLPVEAQLAPIQSMLALDVNEDDFLDVVLVGNDNNAELFAGKQDAFNGLVLYGDGKGNFKPENYTKNGFLVEGDARGLTMFLDGEGGNPILLAAQNRGEIRAFRMDEKRHYTELSSKVAWAVLELNDGTKRRIELAYGHSANAQSARQLVLPASYNKLTLFDSKGQEIRKTQIQ